MTLIRLKNSQNSFLTCFWAIYSGFQWFLIDLGCFENFRFFDPKTPKMAKSPSSPRLNRPQMAQNVIFAIQIANFAIFAIRIRDSRITSRFAKSVAFHRCKSQPLTPHGTRARGPSGVLPMVKRAFPLRGGGLKRRKNHEIANFANFSRFRSRKISRSKSQQPPLSVGTGPGS